MHRMVAAIVSLYQHLNAVCHTHEVYRPSACPSCGRGRLWCHGCYSRKADRSSSPAPSLNPVPIPRFICADCCCTCSRLPGCLSPRRWYEWVIQERALLCLLFGTSRRRSSADTGVARSTLRRWWAWLMERTDTFAFHLRSRFPHLGRTVDSTAFWKACLSELSLADAMGWLDQEVDVP